MILGAGVVLSVGVPATTVGEIGAVAGSIGEFATTAIAKLIARHAAIESSEIVTDHRDGLLLFCTRMTSLWINLVLDVSAGRNVLCCPRVAVKPTK